MNKKDLLGIAFLSVFAAGTIMALVSCSTGNKNKKTTSEVSTSEISVPSVVEITFDVKCDDVTVASLSGSEGDALTLPQPERTGYDFLGWYREVTFKHLFAEDTFPSSSLTLYAKWEAKEYTISFDAYGDGTKEERLVAYGDAILYPTPEKEGYTFVAWKNGEDVFDEVTMPAEDVYLTAEWSLNEYHYTYVLNGGTNSENNLETYTIEMQENNLYDAEKEGYTFTGWYTDEELTERVFTYPLEDATFYAKWSVNSYSLTLVSDHGCDATQTFSYDYGEEVTLPVLSEKYYDFLGWYKGEEKIEKLVISEDTTLTASWKATEYTIAYDLDGGETVSSNPETYTVEELPSLEDPTKKGYDFAGWYMDEERTRKFVAFTSGDVTLYAKFTVGTYVLTYDTAGGELLADELHEYNSTVTLKITAKEGYDFAGWKMPDGTIVTGEMAMPYEDTVLTAQWTPKIYTLTLDFGYDSKVLSDFHACGCGVTLFDLERTGYEFDGWYYGETRFESDFEMPAGDLTLTARWTPITYTVAYDSGSLTMVNENKTSYTIEDDRTLKDASVDGYTFAGWYVSEDFDPISKITELPLAEGVTLYAKFVKNTYTITYHYSGYGLQGSFTETYSIGEDDILIPSILRETSDTHTAYSDFLGWYVSSAYEEDKLVTDQKLTWDYFRDVSVIMTDGVPSGNLDVYAKEEDYFTVSGNVLLSVTSYAQEKFKNGTLVIPSSIDGTAIEKIRLGSKYEFELDTLTLEEGITAIESYAFQSWDMVTVNLPSTLTSINTGGFCSCSNLANVNFTSGKAALTIGLYCFKDCTSLKTITLPENLSELSDYVFANAGLNGTFKVPENITKMDANCLSGTKITELDLTSCVNDVLATGALGGMLNLRVLDVASDFTGFRTNLIDSNNTCFETLNYEGTKQQFENQLNLSLYSSNYHFSSVTTFVLLCSDGSEIHYDKSALIPMKVYVRNSETSEYTSYPSVSMNISAGETSYTLTSLPSYKDAFGSDEDYYFVWTGKYTSLTDSDSQQVLVNDGENFYDSITLSPYPVELYGTAYSYTATYTITYVSAVEAESYSPRYYEYTYDYATKSFFFSNTKITSYTIPKLVPTAESCFVFDGWYSTEDFEEGTEVTKITADNYGGYPENITLYAKMDCIYTVSDGAITGLTSAYFSSSYYDRNDSPKIYYNSFDYYGQTITTISGYDYSAAFVYADTNKVELTAVIGEGITTISANAFKNARIKNIELPSTLKSIGEYAFSSATISYFKYNGTGEQFCENVSYNLLTSFSGCSINLINCDGTPGYVTIFNG